MNLLERYHRSAQSCIEVLVESVEFRNAFTLNLKISSKLLFSSPTPITEFSMFPCPCFDAEVLKIFASTTLENDDSFQLESCHILLFLTHFVIFFHQIFTETRQQIVSNLVS